LAWLTFGGVHQIREAVAERKCEKEHVFQVGSTEPFLPDSVAVTRAIEALQVQGFDTSRWHVVSDSGSKAPDGTQDKYLRRNVVYDHRGVVSFTNEAGKMRDVYVELTNKAVVCIVRPARGPFR
jgi:hypothetical protein